MQTPELNKETLVSEKLQLIIILIFLALIFVDKILLFLILSLCLTYNIFEFKEKCKKSS